MQHTTSGSGAQRTSLTKLCLNQSAVLYIAIELQKGDQDGPEILVKPLSSF